MLQFVCDACGNIISHRDIYPYEMKHKTHFCDKKCRADYDYETGHFKRMSELGKAGRQRVMAQSNRDKPRRAKKVCYQL